jgi:triosephosphate isomerase
VAGEVVAYQVKMALHGVAAERVPDIVIAYEPGWAVGEGGTEANPADVNNMHRLIRKIIATHCGGTTSEQVYIVYGGSVTRDNSLAFAYQPEIDGLFIGRGALEVDSFAGIVQTFAAARSKERALQCTAT